MRAVPLLTSLPPSLNREAQGRPLGAQYQRACVESWRAAGFEPVSVNSRRELDAHPDLAKRAAELGVRLQAVERDAHALTGRPHVYLADVLDAGARAGAGAFALANADVMMRPPGPLAERVASLAAGELLLARRHDVSHPDEAAGPAYAHGFDLFGLRVDDSRSLPDIGLAVGAPWWDHYLPVALRARGLRLVNLERAIVHLEHTERWDWDVWRSLGCRYVKGVSALLRSQDYAARPEARAYGELLRGALGPQRRWWPQRPSEQALRRLSDANLAFLAA